MADPKRLGKRGAYRFGELRPPERPAKRPTPYAPSFRPRRSPGAVAWWLAMCAATAAVLGLAAAFGLWFLPFVAGIAAGVVSRSGPWRARSALGLAVLAVAVGWGAALWWPALSGAPMGATARTVAALAGLPPYAWVGVAGTLLVGVGQAVVAFWLARALTYRWR